MQKMSLFRYRELQALWRPLVKEHSPHLCLPRLEAELSGKLLLTGFFFFFSSTLGRPEWTAFP
jgi:hypothetical protein